MFLYGGELDDFHARFCRSIVFYLFNFCSEVFQFYRRSVCQSRIFLKYYINVSYNGCNENTSTGNILKVCYYSLGTLNTSFCIRSSYWLILSRFPSISAIIVLISTALSRAFFNSLFSFLIFALFCFLFDVSFF